MWGEACASADLVLDNDTCLSRRIEFALVLNMNTSCRVLRQVFRAAERDAGRKLEHDTGRVTSRDQSRSSPAFALKPPKSRRGSREHRIVDWPYCIPNRGFQK